MTRAFTKSPFDHVAMVLRFDTEMHDVYLLEATGNQGVALNKWSFIKEHIGPNKFYRKMIFRHI